MQTRNRLGDHPDGFQASPSGVLKGHVASKGIAFGKAFVLAEKLRVPSYEIKPSDVKGELIKFDGALASSRDQLIALKKKNWESKRTVQVIDSQLMILKDPLFVGEVIQRVREERRNIEGIVLDVVEEISATFENMQDTYMKDRAFDFRDVGSRILRVLMGKDLPRLDEIDQETILVCPTLSPSEVAHLNRDKVLGIVSETGGITSHAAILARGLNICAIVGVPGATSRIKTGDDLILDAIEGTVQINPPRSVISDYEELLKQVSLESKRTVIGSPTGASTGDGVELIFRANIGVPQEVSTLSDYGAQGVGLFRTEYLFLNAQHIPTEDEQFESYRSVVENLGGEPAVFRTIDLGGDKNIPFLRIPEEANPSLGWRSIRFCLDNPHIFRPQLRALLRASHYGPLRIMYPMISSVDEVIRANDLLDQARRELSDEGHPFDPNLMVGAMIELPAAALVADHLAREVDFFSLGTNDLIQFTMAMDRTSERFASTFEYLSLPVIRLIHQVVGAAAKEGVTVACCGEISGTSAGLLLLVGLGLREFSMNVFSIPQLRQFAPRITAEKARQLAEQALSSRTNGEIKKLYDTYLAELG